MRILIVEDDRITRQWLKNQIEKLKEDYYVIVFSNGRQAFNYLMGHQVDIIFVDVRMPVMDGLELIRELENHANSAYKIVLSTVHEAAYAARAMELGANRHILKSEITKDSLEKILSRARAYLQKHERLEIYPGAVQQNPGSGGRHANWPGRLGGSRESVNYSLPVQKIIQYIEEHYWERVTLGQVADNVYLSRSYVSVLFKRETGWKFCDYLQEVRLRNACEFLLNSSCSIQEVAAQTGFFDTPHFSRVFKEKMGVSPSQYRKIHQSFKPCNLQ